MSNPDNIQFMDYLHIDTSNCSLGRAVELVGQPWVMLILREVVQGIHRFSDMHAHTGVSKSVLSGRLDALVASGILELRDYQEPGQRRRYEYHLTEKGEDLYPVLAALRQWGDKYLADPEGPMTLVEHRGCGAPVHAVLMCDAGHPVPLDEIERRPGPGARLRDGDLGAQSRPAAGGAFERERAVQGRDAVGEPAQP
jgi:DNA-binding HxlR family transcriptional regulator